MKTTIKNSNSSLIKFIKASLTEKEQKEIKGGIVITEETIQ